MPRHGFLADRREPNTLYKVLAQCSSLGSGTPPALRDDKSVVSHWLSQDKLGNLVPPYEYTTGLQGDGPAKA